MPDYIDCKPIMLPITDLLSIEGYSDIPLLYKAEGPDHKSEYEVGRNGITSQLLINKMGFKAQHLYLVSEEEIKEGDFYEYTGLIFQRKGLPIGKSGQRIMATTDKSLGLPLIPSSFVEEWVAKQGKIDKVRIRVLNGEPTGFYLDNGISRSPVIVEILPIEDKMYSREEVRPIAQKAFDHGRLWEGTRAVENFDEWFDKTYLI